MSNELRANKFPWAAAVLAFFALGIAGYAIAFYLTGSPLSSGFIQGKKYYQDFHPTTVWTWALVTHVAGGSVALITGALQWIVARLAWRRTSPARFRRFHIVTGVLYAGSILAGAIGGFVLAPQAMGGWVASLGFGLLDFCWVAATFMAVFLGNKVRKSGNGADMVTLRRRHRGWMLRSYALTSAAITLRLWLPIFTALLGLDFVASYLVIAYLCWVPNLVVAEIIARRRY